MSFDNLLVGGTPCQSFSVAGKRLGLDDPRGNLAIEYCRLARRLRPRWIVWENVPGVLSSNGGRDFGAFLGLLVECGYGFAYRVLDAQYVRVDGYPRAVPQRRQRVFVVGYLGDWRRAASVLFEPLGMRGFAPPRREAREDVAVSPTLRAGGNRTGGDRPPGTDVDTIETLQVVRRPIAFDTTQITSPSNWSNPQPCNPCHPLSANGHPPAIVGSGVRRLTPRECERLQGLRDGYTDVPWRSKLSAPDGPRYKAIGNSMAVNVMRWIGMRIAAAEAVIPQIDAQLVAP